MASPATEQAARVTGPIAAADLSGLTGVMRYAVSTSDGNVALPARDAAQPGSKKSKLSGRFIRMLAMGANVQYAFGTGTSAPDINLNETSALGTGDVNAGATLVNGIPEHVMVPSEATYLAWVGDGNGFLEFYVSDQPVP
jgi:hypothetical protein